MKRLIYVIVVAVVFFTVRFAFAEKMEGPMMGQGMKEKGMMRGKEMMGKGMMMHSMMQTSMVASNDGGVIVLTGNKLTKYDKDLNVVKEVELKANTEAMQGMMKDMMERCPMMGQPSEEKVN